LKDSPDLFPILSILACAAKGKSTISGTNRLLNKESNRLEAISALLTSFSVEFEIGENFIAILGTGKIIPIQSIDSCNDHRIAMAAAIGALISDSAIVINNVDCIQKSYPDFFSDIEKVKS
jgi:3-phosphoshikimate 1-carboxyvinyltransferase